MFTANCGNISTFYPVGYHGIVVKECIMFVTIIRDIHSALVDHIEASFEVLVFQNNEYLDSYFVKTMVQATEKAINLLNLR